MLNSIAISDRVALCGTLRIKELYIMKVVSANTRLCFCVAVHKSETATTVVGILVSAPGTSQGNVTLSLT